MISNVHKNISMMRKVRNLSQEKMAELIGMETSTYAKIERGETKTFHNKLEKIAEVLQVDIYWLLKHDDSSNIFGDIKHNITGIVQAQVYYNNSQNELTNEIAKLNLQLEHQHELLLQKDKEIEFLKKLLEK